MSARAPALAPGLAGWAVMFTGLGLARFAFTPLLPAMIEAGWFTPGGGAAQGAANLAGYLLGAALAFPLARRMPVTPLLRGGMALAAASLAACMLPPDRLVAGHLLFGIARLLSGAAGGVLVVLGPPAVLAAVVAEQRGRIGGMVFAGVGFAIAGAGTVLPWLIAIGLPVAWGSLAAAALLLTLLSWPLYPPTPALAARTEAASPDLARLIAGYACNALGVVPHMLLLSDFVARGLGAGVTAGAFAFAVYGVGAICGPLAGGAVADRLGFRRTLRGAVMIQAVAILLPALFPGLAVTVVSGIVVGASTPGVPPLVLGRAVELAGPQRARRAWAAATIAYAACQGAAAWGIAAAFAATGLYAPLFIAGSLGAALSALIMDRARPSPRR